MDREGEHVAQGDCRAHGAVLDLQVVTASRGAVDVEQRTAAKGVVYRIQVERVCVGRARSRRIMAACITASFEWAIQQKQPD